MSSTNESSKWAIGRGEDASARATAILLVRTMSGHFGLANNPRGDHTVVTQAAYPTNKVDDRPQFALIPAWRKP